MKSRPGTSQEGGAAKSITGISRRNPTSAGATTERLFFLEASGDDQIIPFAEFLAFIKSRPSFTPASDSLENAQVQFVDRGRARYQQLLVSTEMSANLIRS
jgi:hypothetical protein